MSQSMDRRRFLAASSTLGVVAGTVSGNHAAAGQVEPEGPRGRLRKAACIGVLPRELSVLDRFKLAKEMGFEGIEPNTLETAEEVAEYREAADSTGIRIHSIMNSDHWKYPLTDNDPEVVRQCVEGVKRSMHNAKDLGADAVLLVPGIVTADVGYGSVYRRSQTEIRKLIPLAKELKVTIAVENVGNRFLLSPLEFARYIDEFKSPWVKAYFDVGNITSMGFPPDWIRTLGEHLLKVHIKKFEPGVEHPGFDRNDRRTQGIDWPDVRKALADVKYSGWVTAEVKSGDRAYLQELSTRIDRIFEGNAPA